LLRHRCRLGRAWKGLRVGGLGMVRQEGRARGVGKGITQERDWYRERERERYI